MYFFLLSSLKQPTEENISYLWWIFDDFWMVIQIGIGTLDSKEKQMISNIN
jgi:predicted PolB exonuclease-like 3'-5' exonuclease